MLQPENGTAPSLLDGPVKKRTEEKKESEADKEELNLLLTCSVSEADNPAGVETHSPLMLHHCL